MDWQTQLNHLIADGKLATTLESLEILTELLSLSAAERWEIIISRDARLNKLIDSDYQKLLNLTATENLSNMSQNVAHISNCENCEIRNHLAILKLMPEDKAPQYYQGWRVTRDWRNYGIYRLARRNGKKVETIYIGIRWLFSVADKKLAEFEEKSAKLESAANERLLTYLFSRRPLPHSSHFDGG